MALDGNTTNKKCMMKSAGSAISACTDYGGRTKTHFLKLVDRDAGLGIAVPALNDGAY